MRSGGGKPGTATSRCVCWPTLSLLSPVLPPVTRKPTVRFVKKGFRFRVDRADGARGKERVARHGRARRGETGLQARVVIMETDAPGCCQVLEEGRSRRQRRPQSPKNSRPKRYRTENDGGGSRGGCPHRSPMGAD